MNRGKLKKMASKWRYWEKPTKVGYKRKGYDRSKSIAGFKKTGTFKNVQSGQGHAAGYEWAKRKGIDPHSPELRYSKNSPSFDEGVYKYKMEMKNKMAGMASRSPKRTPPKGK